MPLNKQKKSYKGLILWSLIAILILLMLVSFSAPQHLTEIVLYP